MSLLLTVLFTLTIFPHVTQAAQVDSIPLQTALTWTDADNFGAYDYQVSQPKTGYAFGFYTMDNGDGTVSALIAPPLKQYYDRTTGTFYYASDPEFYVERYDASGNIVSTKTFAMELPLFGAFFSGEKYNYMAFGQNNEACDDAAEVWRIVQYDKEWNRIASVSINGADSYTSLPFRSTVARMAESDDGESLVLYAARRRYDGHQSNITFVLKTNPLEIETVLGSQFPVNHVSHSFGQFVQYDGSTVVTVDHGDAYPRSFCLQYPFGNLRGQEFTLLSIYGNTGDNATNAIGSGLEVSADGYLFLGCSNPQNGTADAPWNVFLTFTDKATNSTELTWITSGTETIKCARLVKINSNTFVVMWSQSDGFHWQLVDGNGNLVGEESVLSNVPMPSTQPIVYGRQIRWIQTAPGTDNPQLYTLEIPFSLISSRGDVNSDGSVDVRDLTILSSYYAGLIGYEEKIESWDEADIDGNGIVERNDVMLLARYLNNWGGYIID